jgi:ATP-dependent helicase HepA
VKGLPHKLTENADIARRVLPAMFQAAEKVAETRAVTLRQSALNEMNRLLGHEVERLQSLAQVNNHIRPQEIQLARTQQHELASAIQQSRLRLDSLRLIWKGSPASSDN